MTATTPPVRPTGGSTSEGLIVVAPPPPATGTLRAVTPTVVLRAVGPMVFTVRPPPGPRRDPWVVPPLWELLEIVEAGVHRAVERARQAEREGRAMGPSGPVPFLGTITVRGRMRGALREDRRAWAGFMRGLG